MSDIALTNAEAARADLITERLRLQERVSDIDKEIRAIESWIDDWNRFASGGLSAPNTKSGNQNKEGDSPSPTLKTTGNSRKEEVSAVARQVILERGEPIMRDELHQLLTKRGLTINGKDPYMVLSTMLWRMRPEIIRFGLKGGYWPGDVAYEPLGYEPMNIEQRERAERFKERYSELKATAKNDMDNEMDKELATLEEVLPLLEKDHPDFVR